MEKNKQKQMLAFIAEDIEKAAIDEQNRTIRFVINSNKLDRDNEIVEPSAVAAAIKEFSKNPVCLACHQHHLDNGMPPVVGSWDTDSFKELNNRCEMDLRFAVTELGETYWKLYKDKHMRAVSIGFRVLDYHEEMNDGRRTWIITKIELYEISCVPVPSNREALSKLKQLGVVDEDFKFAEKLNKKEIAELLSHSVTEPLERRLSAIENTLEDLKDLMIPGADEDLSMLETEDDPSDAEVNPKEQLLEALKNVLNSMEH